MKYEMVVFVRYRGMIKHYEKVEKIECNDYCFSLFIRDGSIAVFPIPDCILDIKFIECVS